MRIMLADRMRRQSLFEEGGGDRHVVYYYCIDYVRLGEHLLGIMYRNQLHRIPNLLNV